MQFWHDLYVASRITIGIALALAAIGCPSAAFAALTEEIGTAKSSILLALVPLVAAPLAYALLHGYAW
jgi:hypothetical protein